MTKPKNLADELRERVRRSAPTIVKGLEQTLMARAENGFEETEIVLSQCHESVRTQVIEILREQGLSVVAWPGPPSDMFIVGWRNDDNGGD